MIPNGKATPTVQSRTKPHNNQPATSRSFRQHNQRVHVPKNTQSNLSTPNLPTSSSNPPPPRDPTHDNGLPHPRPPPPPPAPNPPNNTPSPSPPSASNPPSLRFRNPRSLPSRTVIPQTSPTPPPDVSFSTAASSAPTLTAALTEAASRALANLNPPAAPHVAIIFISARYCVANIGPSGRDTMDLVVPKLRALVPELKAVIGCTADGVIGAGPTGDVVELEDVPAVSLTLARLPRINITTFHVMPDDLPSLDASQAEWKALVRNPECAGGDTPAFLILSDPGFAERGGLNRFLSGVEYAYPGSSVIGSLASTGAAFAKGHLFCTLPRDVLSVESRSLRDSGLVGVSLTGDVEVDCLVSGGCRAIGPVFEVRKMEGNVMMEMELVGRPSSSLSAMGHLKSLILYATDREKRLIENELYVGVMVDEVGGGEEEEFCVRQVLALDVQGGVHVGQKIRVGQRVRFFVKEMEAAERALDETMQKYKRVELANSLVGYSNPPFGAMVFVDSGRGRGLFREARRETANLTSFARGVPVAGFFGGGQIGPCGGREGGGGAVLHHAANLIALVRRRSGLSPVQPVDKKGVEGREEAE